MATSLYCPVCGQLESLSHLGFIFKHSRLVNGERRLCEGSGFPPGYAAKLPAADQIGEARAELIPKEAVEFMAKDAEARRTELGTLRADASVLEKAAADIAVAALTGSGYHISDLFDLQYRIRRTLGLKVYVDDCGDTIDDCHGPKPGRDPSAPRVDFRETIADVKSEASALCSGLGRDSLSRDVADIACLLVVDNGVPIDQAFSALQRLWLLLQSGTISP